MGRIQCSRGHFYESDKHMSCPYCGVNIDDFDYRQGTVGLNNQPVGMAGTQPLSGQALNNSGGMGITPQNPNYGKTMPQSDFVEKEKGEAKTVAMMHVSGGTKAVEPVVGWLICIDGPEKGKDFRIVAGRNKVGRQKENDICIPSDEAISRDNHTEIIFDPQSRQYYLAAGSGRGLTYLNDALVMESKMIQTYDRIQVGHTSCLFIPLCGEQFSWI